MPGSCPQKRRLARGTAAAARRPAATLTARVPPRPLPGAGTSGRAGRERGAPGWQRPGPGGAERGGHSRAEPVRGVAAPAGQPEPRQPPPRSQRCQCHGVRRGARGSAGARPPDPRGQAPACSPHPGAAAAADRGALEVLSAAAAAVARQDVLQVHLHPAARRGGGKAAGGPGHAAPGMRSGPSAERGAGARAGPGAASPLPPALLPAGPRRALTRCRLGPAAGRGGGGRAARRGPGGSTGRERIALQSRGCRGRRERLQPGKPRHSLWLSPPGIAGPVPRVGPEGSAGPALTRPLPCCFSETNNKGEESGNSPGFSSRPDQQTIATVSGAAAGCCQFRSDAFHPWFILCSCVGVSLAGGCVGTEVP